MPHRRYELVVPVFCLQDGRSKERMFTVIGKEMNSVNNFQEALRVIPASLGPQILTMRLN